MSELVMISKDGFRYSKVCVKEEWVDGTVEKET